MAWWTSNKTCLHCITNNLNYSLRNVLIYIYSRIPTSHKIRCSTLVKTCLVDRFSGFEARQRKIIGKRVLLNFTPDEFCPDHVPWKVFRSRSYDELASLNAAPVSYVPPSSINVEERIVEEETSLEYRGTHVIQLRGYTSDEQLDELESPRTFVIGKVLVSPGSRHNVKQQNEQIGEDCSGSECKI
ncbi:LOW QUALITY PROTEIN: hypothetical protein YC2023_091201 [Brassica napus]